MVDKASSGKQCEDFGRESLELSKDLERMTEQMETISGDIQKQQLTSLYCTLAVRYCLLAR